MFTNVRRKCARFVRKPSVDAFILAVIVVNVLVLCLEFRGQDRYDGTNGTPDFIMAFDVARVVFVVIFTFEAALKLFGWGFRQYTADLMNCFDLFIVLAALVAYILQGLQIQVRPFRCTLNTLSIRCTHTHLSLPVLHTLPLSMHTPLLYSSIQIPFDLTILRVVRVVRVFR